MALRAVGRLDPAAVRAANAELAKITGGRKLTMKPEDAKLRQMWMEAYRKAGGKVEEVKPSNKKAKKSAVDCGIKKTVTGKIATVTFRSDHQQTGGIKLLKKAKPQVVRITQFDSNGKVKTDALGQPVQRSYISGYSDDFAEFTKPEWDRARGGSADSHPVSHTRGKKVTVDIDIDFKVTPSGQTATLERITGLGKQGGGGPGFLSFDVKHTATFGTQRVRVTGLVNEWKLAECVHYIEEEIDWTATVDGKDLQLGKTGKHRIYVTLDTPSGKMHCPKDNSFVESGTTQVVTEKRLETAVLAAWGTGAKDERECVDAVFEAMRYEGIGYFLGTRWENAPKDHTYISPKPSLHHYLWLCNAGEGLGECHNIAASFALYCRIIGVKKPFSVGYMYPWPGREDAPPHNRIKAKSSSGKNVLGKLDVRKTRSHGIHGPRARREWLIFLDGRGRGNNFEGVLVYDGKGLYAIGDDIFDRFGDPHDNASEYYGKRAMRFKATSDFTRGSRRTAASDLSIGLFKLAFSSKNGRCDKPYGDKTGKLFKWEE
jgi:hypothetical protein